MYLIETKRLLLRELSIEDDAFILELLNEPSFIRFIGDKGVRTLEDARRYILEGPVASYARYGYGLYLVELKGSGAEIGICGLVNRPSLADVDVGFAFLPRFWSKGYGYESAAAVMNYARDSLGIQRIVAITAIDNESSIRLLEKIGLRFERLIRLSDEGEQIMLFGPYRPSGQ